MWKYKLKNDGAPWWNLAGAGNTVSSLVTWLANNNNNKILLPLARQSDGTAISACGGVTFRFDGKMGDSEPVEMMADFTLDELERAQHMIAKAGRRK